MGLMRTLYREIRLILGFKAPPENDSQVAERVCGEVKGDVGGKKTQHGDDWMLESKFQGRELKVLFDAAGKRAVIQVTSTLEGGPLFVLVSQASQNEPERGEERKPVTGGLFAQGAGADVATMLELWKALPTGTRGNLTSLMAKHKAVFRYEDGVVRFEPESTLLDGPSAKYNVKSLLQSIVTLTGEMETAWANL